MTNPNPELLQSLAGLNADRERAITQRTRRAVARAAEDSRHRRGNRRRNGALAALVMGGIVALLTPALWGAVEELVGGEHVFDTQMMVMYLLAGLCIAVLAALVLVLRGRSASQQQVDGKS